MKSTEIFKRTIHSWLEQQAAKDELFAASYRKLQKNIDGCIAYILNTVQKSGCSGFADGEIYGMAIYYYSEDNIDTGNPVNCNIAVNHVVELTAEEKEQARRDAIQRVQNETYNRLKQPHKKPGKTTVDNQLSIF
jgi:hypothetical protein